MRWTASTCTLLLLLLCDPARADTAIQPLMRGSDPLYVRPPSAISSGSSGGDKPRPDRESNLTTPASKSGTIIVGLSHGADLRRSASDAVIKRLRLQLGGVTTRRLSFAVALQVADVQAALRTVRSMPEVRWAEPETRIPVRPRASRGANAARDPTPLTPPDDPQYGLEWHLHATDASPPLVDMGIEAAWAVTLGRRDDGSRTRIAVLDDGFDLSHLDLVDRFVPGLGLDVSTPSAPDNDPSAQEHDKHGTQTAGVIAATGWNALGVVGVCPECELLAVRLFGGTGPSDFFVEGSGVAQSIEWAVEHGAAVINNSWGPPDRSRFDPHGPSTLWPMPQVIAEALRIAARDGRDGRGVVVVWASGNGSELATYDRFASDPRAIAVGSVDATGKLAAYSDYGPVVRLVAPSSGLGANDPGIWTTNRTGQVGAENGDFGDSYGGTSASAAMVSGAVGLLLAAHPTLTAAQVTEVLEDTAYPIDPVRGAYDTDGRSVLYGYGRIDVAQALQTAARYTDDCTLRLEVCGNDRDDDCNGEIDDAALCASPCMPTAAGVEACNGKDDNCDGQVDEMFACQSTARPTCAPCDRTSQCASGLRCAVDSTFPGTWCFPSCTTAADCPLGFSQECKAGFCQLVVSADVTTCIDLLRCYLPERCDSVDNDCNGHIDDVAVTSAESVQQAGVCGDGKLGVCASSTPLCEDGHWGCVQPATYEADETLCDGLDNDCDGSIDEAAGCPSESGDLEDAIDGGCSCSSVGTAARAESGYHQMMALVALGWMLTASRRPKPRTGFDSPN